MNGYDGYDDDDAHVRRILGMKAARRAYIDQLCATHNVCAWCGEARVEPGQALCLRCGHYMSTDDLPDHLVVAR